MHVRGQTGRTFLRRMINLLSVAKKMHHRIRLNIEFRSDLLWWATFLPRWNDISMMSTASHSQVSARITSDASSSWGCGTFMTSGWPETWRDLHITVKELLPIVMAWPCGISGLEEQSSVCATSSGSSGQLRKQQVREGHVFDEKPVFLFSTAQSLFGGPAHPRG